MKRRLTLAAQSLVAGALVLATAAPAFAHVTVNPREANKGSYTKLAFRVPNERDDAGTVKLEVQFPAEYPFRSVSVKPVVGWQATISKSKLPKPLKDDDGNEVTDYVSNITWEADKDVRVNPGEFAEFEVSAGPTPEDADQLVFKALQTYDGDGEVVRWIEEAKEGSDEEPEHPAPVLKLVDPDTAGMAGMDKMVADAVDKATADNSDDLKAALAAAESAKDDVDAARAIAIAAAVVAAVAVLLALRRPKAASTS